MNVIGIGTDLCDCDRIARMIERHQGEFVSRVFTQSEIEYCGERKAFVEHYSGRWAAKEAILKALGTGWARGIKWTDLEIINSPSGAPVVVLHNMAKTVSEEQRICEIKISISHTSTQAIAFAIATGVPSMGHLNSEID